MVKHQSKGLGVLPVISLFLNVQVRFVAMSNLFQFST